MKNRMMRMLGVALLLGVAATTAFAGGPNYVYDNVNKVPYLWYLDHWPNGQVPVYTDLGGLGLLTEAQATDWAVGAWDEWNNVPTSKFQAHRIGDVSLLGLGDITPANVSQVYPHFNGGGVTVVYDYDGKIFRDYLGLGLNFVLGIAYPEYFASNSNEILESTVFINGYMQYFNDYDGAGLSGVFTHEFGHVTNLAHTQANGAVWNPSVRDWPKPTGCASGPYPGGSGVGPNVQQLETMYPLIDQTVTGTGRYQFSVDRDGSAAISDLYPAPGWPADHATLKGTIRTLTKINGSGSGTTQEVTGVNLIARNVADPYNDFMSQVSGHLTRGATGPDGSFEMHGLTPGATYVLYTDRLAAGAFPVPRLITLPGPEEWYNGALESGNGETDNRCAWTPVPVATGAAATADITFNRVKGAPSWTFLNFNGEPFSMTPDGSTMVGLSTNISGIWLWSQSEGYSEIGGTYGTGQGGGEPRISDDGTKVAGNVKDANGVNSWGLWDRATRTWTILPRTPTSVPCAAGAPGALATGSVWGISGDGSTVVGGTYNSANCRTFRATKWTAAGGIEILPKYPQSSTARASRASWVNYDGSVIVGWDQTPPQIGAYWLNGVEYFLGDVDGDPLVNQVVSVTRDGSQMLGGQRYTPFTPEGAWKYYPATGERQIIHEAARPDGTSQALYSDDSGNVVSGFDRFGNISGTEARIWTPQLGWLDMSQFMNAQGVYQQDTASGWVKSFSADGRIWAGMSATSQGTVPWRVEIPTAIVCHKAPKGPNTTAYNLAVPFPDDLGNHLDHGDTFGLCPNGGP